MRSVICQFIQEHPDDYEEKLNALNIKVGHKEHYAIFNYGIAADFFHPLVKEARGIIIDLDSLMVVCWPFTKFGNYFESYADNIDWESARVQEKVDGSIIKLWYRTDAGQWQFSTNSVIDPTDGAPEFVKAINKAKEKIDFSILDPDYTYIFELVSPLTKVIIGYPETKFYHTGTRNNRTGEEVETDIGLPKPKVYSAHSLKECIMVAEQLNQGPVVEEEGFVVVDKDYHRIKVKSPKYLEAHRLKAGVSKRTIIQMLREPEFDMDAYLKQFPEQEEIFLFYQSELDRLKHDVDAYAKYVRTLYDESGEDRKAVALQIKGDKLSGVGFSSLQLQKTTEELFDELSDRFLMDNTEDFEFA